MPAASIEALMSAIGIGPVAQRPSRGLTIVPADGNASCEAEGDPDAATTTVALGDGLVNGVAAAEQPTSARDRTTNDREHEPVKAFLPWTAPPPLRADSTSPASALPPLSPCFGPITGCHQAQTR